MTDSSHLPEPLLDFGSSSSALITTLANLDASFARYQSARASGRVLPASTEALRIELTYNSNAIEGSTLSLRDTQLIIEGLAPSGGKSMREIYEARNHDRALRTLENWVQTRPAISPLSTQDLLDTHAIVMADIDSDGAGVLRTHRVLIAGSNFIPPGNHRFPELLPKLLDLANRPGTHPALQAAEFHYNFVAVHPFADGNGRTARLLMNYLLLRRGYPLTIIDVSRRSDYLTALDAANAGDTIPFAEFVAQCIERSMEKLLGTT